VGYNVGARELDRRAILQKKATNAQKSYKPVKKVSFSYSIVKFGQFSVTGGRQLS
jgi:hypothetical protein